MGDKMKQNHNVSVNVKDSVVMGDINVSVTAPQAENSEHEDILEYAKHVKEVLEVDHAYAQQQTNPDTGEYFASHDDMLRQVGNIEELEGFIEKERIALKHTDYRPQGLDKRMQELNEMAQDLGHETFFEFLIYTGRQEDYDYYQLLLERANN